jgi:DNA (cytosine-5)-methyltransferase 1
LKKLTGTQIGRNVRFHTQLNFKQIMTILTTEPQNKAVFDYLRAARKQHTQVDLAKLLEVDTRTLRRWEARQSIPPNYIIPALKQLTLPLQADAPNDADFTFIDLFAGIGGIRTAFEDVGGHCVFTSEWDSYSQKTYAANFPDGHVIAGDITEVNANEIPDHDILLAGFPCQPFSIAGVSKKNSLGHAHGFADETQGTLFFDVARIIEARQPRAFLLENVKNLQSHDKGRTFDVIKRTLTEELGYHIHVKVIDAAHFVPQHRERVIIIGFRDPVGFDWSALRLPAKGERKLNEILHKTDGNEPDLPWDEGRYFEHKTKKVLPKFTLTDNLWNYLQAYAEKHRLKGNGFGFGLVTGADISRTLSARYYKDGSEILIKQLRKNPRRLTPRECARLMGLSDTFKIPVSDSRAYRQFGNCVAVPVIREAARLMVQFVTAEQNQPDLLYLAAAE